MKLRFLSRRKIKVILIITCSSLLMIYITKFHLLNRFRYLSIVKNRDTAELKKIVIFDDINTTYSTFLRPDLSGWTLAMWSSYLGDEPSLSVLLQHGADTTIQDGFGRTALNLAIESRSLECVRALISYGSNVNHIDGGGTPLLHLSIMLNTADITNMLLDNGADPLRCDRNSQDALSSAIASRANAETFAVILKYYPCIDNSIILYARRKDIDGDIISLLNSHVCPAN